VATTRSTKDKIILWFEDGKTAYARMFKREIRKFPMAGTLTAMITTVKNDEL
jgi:hypothetical protein